MTLDEAKALYPHNTPVWHFPIDGTKVPSWTRGEPIKASDDLKNEHGVYIRIKDCTMAVNVNRLELRVVATGTDGADERESALAEDTQELAAQPVEPLIVYAYAASVNGPRGTIHLDGTVTRPEITSHADYVAAREEIGLDLGVSDHSAIQIHHFTPIGKAAAAPKAGDA